MAVDVVEYAVLIDNSQWIRSKFFDRVASMARSTIAVLDPVACCPQVRTTALDEEQAMRAWPAATVRMAARSSLLWARLSRNPSAPWPGTADRRRTSGDHRAGVDRVP